MKQKRRGSKFNEGDIVRHRITNESWVILEVLYNDGWFGDDTIRYLVSDGEKNNYGFIDYKTFYEVELTK